MDVAASKEFAFTLVPAASGALSPQRSNARTAIRCGARSVYVVGNVDILGNWNAAQAVKLNPDGPYPTWTGLILEVAAERHHRVEVHQAAGNR